MNLIPAAPAKSFDEMSREELLHYVQGRQEEGIRITFAGKDAAKTIARKVQPRTSRRINALCVGPEEEQARNTILEGENLQAMVTLYKARGQVDLVLTDPPYNTGNDFRYNDKWDEDPNDPNLGDFVGEDDGARRTKWMKFMLPRLRVMKGMLKPAGVLAICIDHRELFRLGQMLDEVFGEQNRIGIINWQKSYAPRNDNKHLSTATEYVLVYAKDIDEARTGLLDRTHAMDSRYRNPDNDPDGDWRASDPTAQGSTTHPGMVYAIQNPFTGELQWPPEGAHWRSERKAMIANLEGWGSKYEQRDIGTGAKALILKGATLITDTSARGGVAGDPNDPVVIEAAVKAKDILDKGPWPRLFFMKNGLGRTALKRYMKFVKKGVVPMSYWADEDYDEPFEIGSTSWDHEESGHSQSGIRELDAIVGKGHEFETVKPLKLFLKIIQIWCPPKGLVLDPFAGSGTSGHAVLALNHRTGSSRRFILIEQGRPDKGDGYARTLTANRLRRAVTGNWSSGLVEGLGGGFGFSVLQKKVDAKALLGMERDEMTDTVIASHFDANKRGAQGLILMSHEGYEYLVAKNAEGEGFYLVWNGSSTPPVMDEAAYDSIVQEGLRAGLKPFYHVYARFRYYQSDDVRFYQIPDRILLDFGLTLDDMFNNESE